MRLFACLIVAPQRGYDEPATLSYAISSFCPTSADGLHSPSRIKKLISGLHSSIPLVRCAWHRIRLGLDLWWLRLNDLGLHLLYPFQPPIKNSRKILL